MREYLSKPVYKALKRTIANGEKLDYIVADAVASAMKAGRSKKARRTSPTSSIPSRA